MVIDACVLMSAFVTDVLLALGDAGLLRPAWSERIGMEWRHHAVRIWRQSPEALQQRWDEMQDRFPAADAGDLSPYEPGLRYSDPKDWHVIAAARAQLARHPDVVPLIATWNLKDFNRSELRRLGILALSPDTLLVRCARQDGDGLRRALHWAAQQPPLRDRPVRSLADTLERERLTLLMQWLARTPDAGGPAGRRHCDAAVS